MPRYINVDNLIKKMQEQYNDLLNEDGYYDHFTQGYGDALSTVENEPTVDVQKVKHGYWIPSPDGINPISCSECNMPAPFAAGENEFGDFDICRYPSSYCHECGARMDGKGTKGEKQ